MVAHVPMLHYPDAKQVLVVGLGAGTTASRFLYYDIEQLDIVDIEPKLFAFTRQHFPSAWMDDARVRLLPGDGRNFVKHGAQTYDLISVEIGQLDRPGVGVFYTQEFYHDQSICAITLFAARRSSVDFKDFP
jgi:spermidine synthase